MASLPNAPRGFEPGLFDKLFDDAQPDAAPTHMPRLSIDELKDAVARDREALLNSRCVIDDSIDARYPLVARSILRFGLPDFCGMSLANPADRRRVCDALGAAIGRHEPRLRDVKVRLDFDVRAANQLRFSIAAVLVVSPAREIVSFDALLQPATQQYSVVKSRRAAAN